LCPNLKPSSPLPSSSPSNKQFSASLVGDKYLMLEVVEGSTLCRCVNVHTKEELVCKVRPVLIWAARLGCTLCITHCCTWEVRLY
jgi:tribbles-like protein